MSDDLMRWRFSVIFLFCICKRIPSAGIGVLLSTCYLLHITLTSLDSYSPFEFIDIW